MDEDSWEGGESDTISESKGDRHVQRGVRVEFGLIEDSIGEDGGSVVHVAGVVPGQV